MSKRVRQLIFFVVFTLSVLGLTVILIYSAGYRLDTTSWRLQPTGSIRVAVEPSDHPLILLLPNGDSSTNNETSFTHLLPGTYHLYIEATNYQPANFELTVEPNATVILDPLRLWPIVKPEIELQITLPSSDLTLSDLTITLQGAISQLGIFKQDLELIPIDDSTVVVLNTDTSVVQLLSQSGNVVEKRSLGAAQSVTSSNAASEVLLVSQFSLQRVNINTGVTETFTRLSRPIGAAAWLGETPYIAYSIANEIHMLDSRIATGYSDQLVAELDTDATQLWYNADTDQLYAKTSLGNIYSLLLSLE